jgi:predicted XRE-type DNA-binding protein
MTRQPSARVDAQMAAGIKFLRTVMRLHVHQVAQLYGINQGRVSEVMHGKRFAEVAAAPDPRLSI